MLRKLLFTSLVGVFMGSAAFAETLPYVGADLGTNYPRWSASATTSADLDGNGFIGGAFVGFGGDISPTTYAAIEGFGDLSTADSNCKTITTSSGAQSISIKERYTLGVSVLPAVRISNTAMIYGRGGLLRARFDVNQGGSTTKSLVNGGQVGVGVQGSVNQHLAVRGEYDFNIFRNFSVSSTSIRTRDNQFKLGVIYQFA